jgi:cell division protein FtsB
MSDKPVSSANSKTTEPIEHDINLHQRRKPRTLSSAQIVFAVIVAVGLMLSINFSTRITADRDLQRIREAIVQEIALLEKEQVTLLDELSYVESDAYVEAWARSESRMVREGEILVLPVPSAIVQSPLEQNTNTPIFGQVETTRPEPENWELWWSLFFDTSPPNF